MKKDIKRKIATIVVSIFIATRVAVPAVVLALPDLPDRPDSTSPETVETPDETRDTDTPDTPDNYKPEEAEEDEADEETEVSGGEAETQDSSNSEEEVPETSSSTDTADTEEEAGTSNSSGDNSVGDVKVKSGDVDSSGSIVNTGNTNLAGSSVADNPVGGVAVVNSSNGTGSSNSGAVVVTDSNTTTQNNEGELDNSLEVEGDSGNNSASRNVGDSEVITGDVNVSGSIMNAVNTNIEGVYYSEFNILDDQTGDYILDFGGAMEGITAANCGNGSESVNDAEVETVVSDATFQTNSADVTNELVLSANTGMNTADNNTGGDSIITTGDANISGSILNFINNNLAGGIVYGVVNIFGDFIGDIILPEEYAALFAANAANSNNGSGSTNSAATEVAIADEINQFNNAQILNNIDIAAVTGENTASDNTGGNSVIDTGDVSIDARVINFANNNIVGGNWWVVFVNEAGNWIGKIFALPGSAVGENYAASTGTSVEDLGNGVVNVSNTGNGSDSENSSSAEYVRESELTQTNEAVLTNNVSLSANTGGNSTSRNTGGDNEIVTGDANVMLNLVNFVNNNIAGGRMLVTVINVFGSWIGDLVGPGYEKEELAAEQGSETSGGTGGMSSVGGSSNTSQSSSGGSSSTSSSTASTESSNNSVTAMSTATVYRASSYKLSGSAAAAGEVQAAEESDNPSVLGAASESGKTRVNLAWGLMAFPAYLGYVVNKKTSILARLIALLPLRK